MGLGLGLSFWAERVAGVVWGWCDDGGGSVFGELCGSVLLGSSLGACLWISVFFFFSNFHILAIVLIT
jgi:hypothetical protein